jgi:hypothetical protein
MKAFYDRTLGLTATLGFKGGHAISLIQTVALRLYLRLILSVVNIQ